MQDSTAPDDDRRLVARIRAGDADAYALLVDRYAERLHNTLLHLANGDAELAAEFTQEAFVRAWEKLDQFAGASSFYTWLYRLARNRAIDLLARKRPSATDQPILEQAAGVSDSDPADDSQRDDLQQLVQQALTELEPDQREIILLRDFDGLDYEAISTALGIAVGTVKSRLNRARTALRERLEPHLAGGGL